jgi:hypothetical protein
MSDPMWLGIADKMWSGQTIQQACTELGLEYENVRLKMNAEMKAFLLDVSMLANYRDTELCQQQY